YEALEVARAQALMAELTAALPGLAGQRFGPLVVSQADSFCYVDPVDGSTSANQGLRVLFACGSRVVFRLSGTGTEGATLRVYLEAYQPPTGEIDRETPDMLADLIAAAEAIAGIARHTGRSAPDVVT
ncbi:MAG TPA: alpha-D-glucose phosphate-specific phosphoglucomutase, partial [Novosphingobium sp.]|nr:alpha-D-glucose phosphate-specific phosphoglucomutase [Novosphingobium sp.]